MNFCGMCGTKVDGAKYCPECGNAISMAGQIITHQFSPAPAPPGLHVGWLIVGWVGAAIMPIVGLVIGILSIVKGPKGVGIGMVVVSLIFWFLWYISYTPIY